MEQQEKLKETQIKIIEAGKEVLRQKDYYETVVEEIAQRAGVAKGTIFFYFKTKENLFKEIMFSLIDEICKAIENISFYQTSPLQKLKIIYDRYIDFNIKNMKLFHSIRKVLSETEPKVEEVKQKLLNISQKILPVIEELQSGSLIKRIDSSLEITEIVPSMLLMYASAVSTMVFFYPEKIEKIKEIFWQILLHGILNEDVSVKMEMFGEDIE
ncbi:MAG: TetR/AcrR family transcriptional regulator [Endomicrobia bacterium]|nr:TetR/AcrR family transcriptional regulator [Endomicrobiia bacterium]